MAKTDNEFNINGKLGNLIFFQRNGKSFVKKNTIPPTITGIITM